MHSERANGRHILELTTVEYRTINNAFAWLCFGTHGLEGEQLEEKLGASEDELHALMDYIHERETGLSLDDGQLLMIDACLGNMVDGEALLGGSARFDPDWAVLGVTDVEFADVRHSIRLLADGLRDGAV